MQPNGKPKQPVNLATFLLPFEWLYLVLWFCKRHTGQNSTLKWMKSSSPKKNQTNKCSVPGGALFEFHVFHATVHHDGLSGQFFARPAHSQQPRQPQQEHGSHLFGFLFDFLFIIYLFHWNEQRRKKDGRRSSFPLAAFLRQSELEWLDLIILNQVC